MPEQSGQYPIAPSDADELQRLSLQDDLLDDLFPLLPARVTPKKRVLDVACGTGGWLRQIARKYPQVECVGLDTNMLLLDRARIMAENENISNVVYQQGNFFNLSTLYQPTSFDVIHMRCATWFIGDRKREVFEVCARLLMPGGTLVCIDFEQPYPTTSDAYSRFSALFIQALQKRGIPRIGMADLPSLFRSLGLHVSLFPFVLDLSADVPTRTAFLSDLQSVISIFKKVIVGTGVIDDQAYEEMKRQCLDDMAAQGFGMLSYALMISGQKA